MNIISFFPFDFSSNFVVHFGVFLCSLFSILVLLSLGLQFLLISSLTLLIVLGVIHPLTVLCIVQLPCAFWCIVVLLVFHSGIGSNESFLQFLPIAKLAHLAGCYPFPDSLQLMFLWCGPTARRYS